MNSQARSSSRLLVLAGLLAFASAPASAVSLNPHGTGQALLFPYYTVNAGYTTMFSIVNSTAHAKALRVRIAEGEDGRDAASINVYLAPFDTWVATINWSPLPLPQGTLPVVATTDNSCTFPQISNYSNAPLANASGFLELSDAAFTGANADGSKDTAAQRASEGTIEVIEMGTLIDGSASANAAARAAAGSAGACNVLYNAWEPGGAFNAIPDVPDVPGGYWYADPATDLANPTGGLYGTAYIVNVEDGTIFTYQATALDDFRSDPADRPRGSTASVVLHTSAGDARPSLADALNDPAAKTASVDVHANGALLRATYPAPGRGVDAVTAVLMAGTLSNEYVTSTSVGATTNWILSYPTRRFYTDATIVGGAALAPFTQRFAGRQSGITESVPYFSVNRDGIPPLFACPEGGCDLALRLPGTSVEVINFGSGASAMFASALDANFGESAKAPTQNDGSLQMNFDGQTPQIFLGLGTDGPLRLMRPSNEGYFFAGLPVIGFSAQNLVNGNVQNGVLANFDSAVAHKVVAQCYTFSGAPPQPTAVCQ